MINQITCKRQLLIMKDNLTNPFNYLLFPEILPTIKNHLNYDLSYQAPAWTGKRNFFSHQLDIENQLNHYNNRERYIQFLFEFVFILLNWTFDHFLLADEYRFVFISKLLLTWMDRVNFSKCLTAMCNNITMVLFHLSFSPIGWRFQRRFHGLVNNVSSW